MISKSAAPPVDPPCRADPDHWDLASGRLLDWLDAIQICTVECPLATARACRRYTLHQMQLGNPPLGLIQSGVAFTAGGDELEPHQLAGYAARVQQRRRPGRAA